MKAVFGSSQKKPLMTKISTRHLNEIVRERNQYSRDAMEAWQDFINLKGRMDTELTKVTKRNNFLVDELESWKQQFLKFQAFAEQLTKEAQELKLKIDGHKRENRRLVVLIDQQKEDAARMSARLGGTEKQRDDALEALQLQQEIAEELERERKRNKKELGAMQHTNSALLRSRDDAQRVVLHLRALIDGQAHHMEHIVKTLGENRDVSEIIDGDAKSRTASPSPIGAFPESGYEVKASAHSSRSSSRASNRSSSRLYRAGSEDTETRLLNDPVARRRLSRLSMTDVEDRNIRDKTDAIAYIIRNISEQCAAAVEGLHLAQRADSTASSVDDNASLAASGSRRGKKAARSVDGSQSDMSEIHSESSQSYLRPSVRSSSLPPTPELVHGDRSSTSMSLGSVSTSATPDRHSIQSQWRSIDEDVPAMPTRIVGEQDGGVVGELGGSEDEQGVEEPVTKFSPHGLEHRRSMTLNAI